MCSLFLNKKLNFQFYFCFISLIKKLLVKRLPDGSGYPAGQRPRSISEQPELLPNSITTDESPKIHFHFINKLKPMEALIVSIAKDN